MNGHVMQSSKHPTFETEITLNGKNYYIHAYGHLLTGGDEHDFGSHSIEDFSITAYEGDDGEILVTDGTMLQKLSSVAEQEMLEYLVEDL